MPLMVIRVGMRLHRDLVLVNPGHDGTLGTLNPALYAGFYLLLVRLSLLRIGSIFLSWILFVSSISIWMFVGIARFFASWVCCGDGR